MPMGKKSLYAPRCREMADPHAGEIATARHLLGVAGDKVNMDEA